MHKCDTCQNSSKNNKTGTPCSVFACFDHSGYMGYIPMDDLLSKLNKGPSYYQSIAPDERVADFNFAEWKIAKPSDTIYYIQPVYGKDIILYKRKFKRL